MPPETTDFTNLEAITPHLQALVADIDRLADTFLRRKYAKHDNL